jgi:hypothetical protein
MNWLATLLGKIENTDLSGPLLGIKTLTPDECVIRELPEPLQKMFQVREQAREVARDILGRIKTQYETHDGEVCDGKNCRAHLKTICELERALVMSLNEYILLQNIFSRELMDITGDELNEHNIIGVRDGKILVGCVNNAQQDLDEVDRAFNEFNSRQSRSSISGLADLIAAFALDGVFDDDDDDDSDDDTSAQPTTEEPSDAGQPATAN